MSLFSRGRNRPRRPRCRLTEAEALAIGQRVLGTDALMVEAVTEGANGPAWRIGTATLGSGRSVVIDDATGAPGEVTGWGVR